jgi:predicted amidohydrolase YtcJ
MRDCCDPPLLRYLRASGVLRRRDFLASLGAALAAGCSSASIGIPGTPSSQSATILFNGTILTLAGSARPVTAVAIAGGKILATAASLSDLQSRYPGAATHDLHGATLAPGFVEAHAHISQVLLNLVSHDLSHCKTLHELEVTLRDLVAHPQANGWVFGQGIDESLLRPGFRPPSLAFLDGISKTTPMLIEDSTGHLYYVNSAAIAAANVTPGQQFPGGGLIGGNGNGLEGIVYEFAIGPFFKFADDPSAAQLQAAILTLLQLGQSNGVTTWHDPAAGLFSGSAKDDLDAIYEPLAANPSTPVRVMSSVVLTAAATDPALLRHPRAQPGDGIFYGESRALWIPSLKLWVDGTPQGETASMTQPYLSQPPTTGFPSGRLDWSAAQLRELLATARRHGWSLLLHVNGDRAIDAGLDAVQDVFGGAPGGRFRIRFEHCTVSRADQFPRMKSLGIDPTFLNNHTYIWGDAFRDRIIGPARAARLDAAGDCVRNGMIFSFHCDYGVSQPQPLRYMQTAVTRTTKHGTVIGPEQAISPLEALKGCTIYPARQLGFDHRIGTIEAGKDADFVELAHNPLEHPHDAIASIPVKATWRMGTRIQSSTAPSM